MLYQNTVLLLQEPNPGTPVTSMSSNYLTIFENFTFQKYTLNNNNNNVDYAMVCFTFLVALMLHIYIL